jgi:hypothetical protein
VRSPVSEAAPSVAASDRRYAAIAETVVGLLLRSLPDPGGSLMGGVPSPQPYFAVLASGSIAQMRAGSATPASSKSTIATPSARSAAGGAMFSSSRLMAARSACSTPSHRSRSRLAPRRQSGTRSSGRRSERSSSSWSRGTEVGGRISPVRGMCGVSQHASIGCAPCQDRVEGRIPDPGTCSSSGVILDSRRRLAASGFRPLRRARWGRSWSRLWPQAPHFSCVAFR